MTSLKYTDTAERNSPAPNEKTRIKKIGIGNSKIEKEMGERVTTITIISASKENEKFTREKIVLDIGKMYFGI